MGKRTSSAKSGCAGGFFILFCLVAVGIGLWWSLRDTTPDAPPDQEVVMPEVPVEPEIVEPEAVEPEIVEPEPEIQLPTLPEGTEDWQIVVANKWYPVDKEFEADIEMTSLSGNHKIDTRAYPALQKMMDDCRAAGFSPTICSSYRPFSTQERLFNNKVQRVLAADASLTEEEAKEIAGTQVAVPGTSEHQIGLTVDIVDVNHQILDDSQADTPAQQWLLEHCWDYGFILRYPLGFMESTGIIYEPWHYRYVGVEIAQEIRDENTTLEDYLAQRGLYPPVETEGE